MNLKLKKLPVTWTSKLPALIQLFVTGCLLLFLSGCGTAPRKVEPDQGCLPSAELVAPTRIPRPLWPDLQSNEELWDFAGRCTDAVQICNRDKELIMALARERVAETTETEVPEEPKEKKGFSWLPFWK